MHAAAQNIFLEPKAGMEPVQAMLGLDQEPADPKQPNKFFFASPLTSQRLAILDQMVGGRSMVIAVTGERGSGKTTLMHQFIANGAHRWRAHRIRLNTKDQSRSAKYSQLNNRMVFVSRSETLPSMIIDDAHQLNASEMQRLLLWAFPAQGQRRIGSLVMVAGPRMRQRYREIAKWLPSSAVIDKINMSPLNEKQTADYLHHRIRMAGFSRLPFSKDQIRRIYQLSCGLPGCINGEAYMVLRKMKHHFQSNATLRRWRSVFAWRFRRFPKLSLFRHWA